MAPPLAVAYTRIFALFIAASCGSSIVIVLSEPRSADAPFDETEFVDLVAGGNFTAARRFAQRLLQEGYKDESKVARLYQNHADQWLREAFTSHLGMRRPLKRLVDSTMPVLGDQDDESCWSFNTDSQKHHGYFASESLFEETVEALNPVALWDSCCSQLSPINTPRSAKHPASRKDICMRGSSAFCCDFSPTTSSHLRLPALREVDLRMSFPKETSYNSSRSTNSSSSTLLLEIQQDGFLRMFNPSTILWPTGYLLGLCLSSPDQCGFPELWHLLQNNENYLELGAGVGLPSVLLARQLAVEADTNTNLLERQSIPRIFTADISLAALELIMSNVVANVPLNNITKQEVSIIPMQLNHSDATAVRDFAQRHGRMSLIIGSSLQDVFQDSTRDPQNVLWQTLDTLLDPHDGWVLLAHSVESLQIPQASDFVLEHVRTVSGIVFGMTTRWNAESSDFAISIFRRKRSSSSSSHPRPPSSSPEQEPEL